MSVRASLGAQNALATAPGTACRIFSGHDVSTSGGSSRILKLMALLLWSSHIIRLPVWVKAQPHCKAVQQVLDRHVACHFLDYCSSCDDAMAHHTRTVEGAPYIVILWFHGGIPGWR